MIKYLNKIKNYDDIIWLKKYKHSNSFVEYYMLKYRKRIHNTMIYKMVILRDDEDNE